MSLLPVGHYTGVTYPQGTRTVRIGRQAVTISVEAAFAVWASAHRPLDRSGEPWTRERVVAVATDLGVEEPDPIVDAFLRDGVLVDVTDPEAFARTHRVVPIMLGLGTDGTEGTEGTGGTDEPGIGLWGVPPIVTVPPPVYEVWQWGAAGTDLWSVCDAYARAESGDTAAVLAEFLDALPTLVGVNAAYVDVV